VQDGGRRKGDGMARRWLACLVVCSAGMLGLCLTAAASPEPAEQAATGTGYLRIVLTVKSRKSVPANPPASVFYEEDRAPVTQEEMEATKRVLRSRLTQYGLLEPRVEAQGLKGLVVDIPCEERTAPAEATVRDLLTTQGDIQLLAIPKAYAFGYERRPEVQPTDCGDVYTFRDSKGREVMLDEVSRKSERLAGPGDFEPTSQVVSGTGRWTGVTFELREPARTRMQEYTRLRRGYYIGILFDDGIVSCPLIMSAFPGKGVLELGDFDRPGGLERAKRMSIVLNSGPLPLHAEWTESRFVPAS